jgi:hypothetical protein
MSYGYFIDKSHPPSEDEIIESLGECRENWNSLVLFLKERLKAKSEFIFYGMNYGWSLRFRKNGKAIASLYPAERCWVTQIILKEDDIELVKISDFSQKVQDAISIANPYAEGRWLFIRCENDQDTREIFNLLEIKTKKNDIEKK